MIEIVEGVGVGSGKSYYVCTRIAEHIAKGGTVVATDKFGLVWNRPWGPFSEAETSARIKSYGAYWPRVEGMREYIEDEYGVVPEPDQWQVIPSQHTERFHELTPQGTEDCPVLLVIDEAQDGLGVADVSDQEAKRRKKSLFAWLCQSRHDDNDLIFITQNALNIDCKIRRIATYIIRVRNMVNFSIGGMKTPWWKKFVVNISDAGNQSQKGVKPVRVWLDHDPRVFSAYVSKSQKGQHRRAGIVARKKLRKVQPKSRSLAMKLLLAFLVCSLCGAGVAIYKLSSESPWQPKPVAAAPASVPRATPARISGAIVDRKPKQAEGPEWSTVVEAFRATDGETYLRTSEWTYEPGQMSPHGVCMSISARAAMIKTADRRTVHVIARDEISPRVGVVESRPVIATPPPVPVFASWEPRRSNGGWIEADEARMDAERSKPIGNFKTHR